MSEQCKYYCRVCGAEVIAGPYIAPEACSACQLAANAEIARKAKGGEVMGTSRVAIAGGAFRVRTGNLCTMFRSLESAAEQIALLHDEIERLKARLREQPPA